MWPIVLDAITTAADWPWLDPLTTLVRSAAAVIGLTTAVHRARRSRSGDRYRGDA